MIVPTLTYPAAALPRQEHASANSENVTNIKAYISDQQYLLGTLNGAHIVSARHLNPEVITQLLRLAARFELGEFIEQRPLHGKILSNVFLDKSRNHTRLSFNSAWLRLGGTLLNFEKSVEEVINQRYAPDEIAELCNNYGDITVLRTLDATSFEDMLEHFRVPVINAGNGDDQHPTHALADLYTLFKWRPDLMGLHGEVKKRIQVAVFGEPSQTRTIRSFLDLLAKFPQAVERVVIFERVGRIFGDEQRESLENAGIQIQTVAELHPRDTDMEALRDLLPEMDLIYIHHQRPVHIPRMDIIEAIDHMRDDALVLNPNIQMEEFSKRVNNSAKNGYFAQARGAVHVRMALFSAIMGTRCSDAKT
jgi:aspartate carbamoyltransferase catalytic subunit